jgi:site-specific recombinase XerD
MEATHRCTIREYCLVEICGDACLRAVQLLLGHTKLESTVRYLGIEVDDALEMAEQTEV